MTDRVAVDSGPCIALFNRDDAYHDVAVQFVRTTRAELISMSAVVTETMYVLDFSLVAQLDFLHWVSRGGLTLVDVGAADLERAGELMKKYADRPMDFTDGLLVAICERLNIRQVASVDDDFTVYRFRHRGRFENMLRT